MGSVGDCFDNAMAESFFATLECELLDRTTLSTHAEARAALFEFIEGVVGFTALHLTMCLICKQPRAPAVERGPPGGGGRRPADYFGQIPHAALMQSIARRVSDGRLKAWLEMQTTACTGC